MKISMCICLRLVFTILLFSTIRFLIAQDIKPKIKRIKTDTSSKIMNMDAVYQRPFLSYDKLPVALGGYLEVNSLYSSENGISDGLSFQARRLTLFMSSTIMKRIKFLTEIEFEEGTKEIGIEFAALDVIFHPLINFRGGIIMNPIGAFNQNHDGPKWEFVERPNVAINLLPATFSNPGFGLFGKSYINNWIFGYEAYLSNGFDESIIDNENNKTYLPAVKENKSRFGLNHSGEALLTGKFSLKNRKIGELGFSYMGGSYNKSVLNGISVDRSRRVDVFAIDLNTTIKRIKTKIIGEVVLVHIDVPKTYTQQYGEKQVGFYLDIIQPILQKKIFEWEKAVINLSTRIDYCDWNIGNFNENNLPIGENLWAITPSLSFRPSQQIVFRINYRYQWQRDILNNPTSNRASWLFGISSYF